MLLGGSIPFLPITLSLLITEGTQSLMAFCDINGEYRRGDLTRTAALVGVSSFIRGASGFGGRTWVVFCIYEICGEAAVVSLDDFKRGSFAPPSTLIALHFAPGIGPVTCFLGQFWLPLGRYEKARNYARSGTHLAFVQVFHVRGCSKFKIIK